MPRVRFVEVGRGKVTWEADLKSLDEGALVREIRSKRVLASRDIEVVDSTIIVGGFRPVGRTELVPDENRTA